MHVPKAKFQGAPRYEDRYRETLIFKEKLLIFKKKLRTFSCQKIMTRATHVPN